MAKIKKPPEWTKYFSPNLIQKGLNSSELLQLVKKAEREYVYWDTFKYYPSPPDFTIEESWAYLKFTRISNRENTLIKTSDNTYFTFTTTKTIYQKLSYIDSNTSGFISTEWKKPTETQKNQLIISGLSEEAIASSQIEGANTSRKVAKDMILSKRKPRTKDEQMIINNYQVMQRLLDWEDLNLSVEMLLEIQKNITTETLDNENDSGRLRTNEDNIAVIDSLTGETVFTPPPSNIVKTELVELIKYANNEAAEEEFVHPVVKACILHFWLVYLHPFVDGNGRTARALFYWYLLKKNYWMFQYLSVSRVIKKSKTQYDNSFLYSELDGNDLTYFLSYMVKSIMQSIEDFIIHYNKKLQEDEITEKITSILKGFNERQINLLQHLNEYRNETVDINTHQNKHRVAYQTARTDILGLVEKGFLTQMINGKKYEYIPNTIAIKGLFSKIRQRVNTNL